MHEVASRAAAEFLSRGPALIRALGAQERAHDPPSLLAAALRMRTLSVGVGASSLARLCRAIELMTDHHDLSGMRLRIEEIANEHDRVRRILAGIMKSGAPSVAA